MTEFEFPSKNGEALLPPRPRLAIRPPSPWSALPTEWEGPRPTEEDVPWHRNAAAIAESHIPELAAVIGRYGARLSSGPEFVLVGQYRSSELGVVYGILAAASNEVHAHLLRRAINRNGQATVERTEHHPRGGTLLVGKFLARLERVRKDLHEQRKRRVRLDAALASGAPFSANPLLVALFRLRKDPPI